jgi:hypothetical protein
LGKILFFGGVVLLVLGGLGALVFIKPLLLGQGSMFPNLMAVLILGALPAAAGLALISIGGRRGKLEAENDERGFSEMTVALARKSGGAVALDQVCKASGLPKDEAQARMRTLTGQGLFDMDFDANGQVLWKLTGPASAQLASRS